MSTTHHRGIPSTSALGLGSGAGGPWHQRAVQRSRSQARTYLRSCSVPPTGGPRGPPRNPVRFPSLTAAQRTHRKTPVVSLSFGEPPLFTSTENVLVSGNRRRPTSVRKRPPPSSLLSSRPSSLTSRDIHDPSRKLHSDATHPLPRQNQNRQMPIYTHFSRPIRPSTKTPPPRHLPDSAARTSPGIRSEHGPSVMRCGRGSSEREALSIVGRPCHPGCCRTLALVAASVPLKRTQLHVFLPSGDRAGEGEEADSESVDEGFMDELDSKMAALRLQRCGPKTVPYH